MPGRHDADRKSKAKVDIEKKTGVTFGDVEGIDEAEEELMEVVDFLKNPQKYQRLGGTYRRACCCGTAGDRQDAAGARRGGRSRRAVF